MSFVLGNNFLDLSHWRYIASILSVLFLPFLLLTCRSSSVIILVLLVILLSDFSFFFFFKELLYFYYLFIYLLFAVLGLRFCVRAFCSCGKQGPLFIVVCGPLTIAASLVAEHRLQTRRLSSCGSRAQLLRGMWDLPRPGLEPVSPALAGRLSTTAPPGKPPIFHFLSSSSGSFPNFISSHLSFF